jgi:hypothetical protein
MTDDRSLERAARSWLEAGPTQAPDRAVEAALLRIETTSQERVLRFPWRFTTMPMPARVAVAAVIGVLLVGGAFYVLDRSGQPSVGGPGPASSPTPTASPPPSPSPAALSPAPDGTWGDWQAELDTPLTGVAGVAGHIQLSIDWQSGISSWIQTEAGGQILLSDSVAAPAGEIVYIASDGSVGCQKGDIGRYTWDRSSDGLYLTLTAIEDACTTRAEAYSRTWVHSLSAVNDGGLGVVATRGWLQAMLPSMRFAMGDTDIHSFDDADPSISFVVMDGPEGVDKPCDATSRSSVAIPGNMSGIIDYVRSQPGFDATSTDTTVDGRQAVHLTLTPKASFDCPSGEYAVFRSGSDRIVDPKTSHSIWVVDVSGVIFVLWYEGDGVTAKDEQAVISSLRFLDKLPSP